ncbi:MAG: barstar family protein [Oscillospiraceae bacterium]|jgi:ribonuclease inhibitor|nr:barstar family protein [Oscillospiraceae bacterium]
MELIIDGSALPEAAAVHDLFTRALDLPEWYGRNLDALYDVLTERGEPLRLLVRNREALAEYAEDLLRTLAEAAAENPALELVYE